MKQLCGLLMAVLLWAGVASAQPVTITLTGTLYDNFGNPSVNTLVSVTPLNPTAQGPDLIMANPVATNTNNFGSFTLNPAGGVYSAVAFGGGVDLPTTLILTTLPTSGVVTLSELLAQQSNIVTSFPPNGNLNMNGFTFLNLAGASIVGEPVVEGLGLAGGSIFTSSGTYPIPLNTTYIVATLFAAGGGGGGGHSATNAGGGGGGGELLQCLMLPINGTITVTVGAKGTGGAVDASGTNAVDTTVSQSSSATICDAGGGKLGVHGTGGGAGAGGAGGNSGSEITGAAIQMFDQAGTAGGNGSSGTPGVGGGLGLFGGNGGAPAAAGANGGAAAVVIRAY